MTKNKNDKYFYIMLVYTMLVYTMQKTYLHCTIIIYTAETFICLI